MCNSFHLLYDGALGTVCWDTEHSASELESKSAQSDSDGPSVANGLGEKCKIYYYAYSDIINQSIIQI